MSEINWELRKQLKAERKKRAYLLKLNQDQLMVWLNIRHHPHKPQRVVMDMDKYEKNTAKRIAAKAWKAKQVTTTKKVKLYGEDTHLKNKQIEMQIEKLLIERESNFLDYELQYKINELNTMLK